MKKTCLIFLVFVSCFSLYAQHNVKINATALVFRQFPELQYEYSLNDGMSFQLGAGMAIPKGLSVLEGLDFGILQEEESSAFASLKYRGYRITPEMKFYSKNGKGSPQGFYTSIWFRYYNYSVSSEFKKITSNELQDISFKGTLSAGGLGLGLGTQWLINDRISIDVMWLGVGLRKGKLTGDFSSEDDVDWRQFKDDFEDIKDSNFITKKIEVSEIENGVSFSSKNPLPIILRSSVSVGVFF